MKNTLKRAVILKHDKEIDKLFSSGRWLRSEHIRLIYIIDEEKQDVPCKVMFSAAKKAHRRAVKRNLIKRRMREAYRLNKNSFYKRLEESDITIRMGFIYTSPKISDSLVISMEVKKLLAQLASRLTINKGGKSFN